MRQCGPWSYLLDGLDPQQSYKVCVIERSDDPNTTDPSDPNTSRFYEERGFTKMGTHKLSIPETDWAPEDNEAQAIFLIKQPSGA